MIQKTRKDNQKALFKRALATYTPGMSCRQLAATLQVSASSARHLIYQVQNLASESK